MSRRFCFDFLLGYPSDYEHKHIEQADEASVKISQMNLTLDRLLEIPDFGPACRR
jgi:hypothetical protein